MVGSIRQRYADNQFLSWLQRILFSALFYVQHAIMEGAEQNRADNCSTAF